MRVRAHDQADVEDRGETRDRPEDQRPDDRRGVHCRSAGSSTSGGRQRDPGDRGRDQRRRQRGQHERQRQRAEQHLEREQRAAERDVVDGRHARAGAACDEQAPLPVGQLRPVAERARERRARLLRRRLAAERRAERDDHDRVRAAREARRERQARVAQPDRLGDVADAAARQQHRAAAGDDAADRAARAPCASRTCASTALRKSPE